MQGVPRQYFVQVVNLSDSKCKLSVKRRSKKEHTKQQVYRACTGLLYIIDKKRQPFVVTK